MNFIEYLRGSINNVYSMLKVNKADLEWFGDDHCLYHSSYRPELELTNELVTELTNRFHQIIGVLRC